MTGTDDNELISRVLEGDNSAYREIVERHQGKIFFLGLKFFRNQEDAEDFSQEVFLQAYRRLNTFGGNAPFSAWIYRVGYNLAINKYRVKSRETIDESVLEPIASQDIRPDEGILRKETKDIMNSCLKKLPVLYNIIVKMRYFDGLSYPEISEITEIPVNTIKSHVRRAKQLLMRFINKIRGTDNGKQ